MSDSQYALYLFTSFPPSAPSSRYLTPDQSTSITLCVVGVSVTFSVVVAASVGFSVVALSASWTDDILMLSITVPAGIPLISITAVFFESAVIWRVLVLIPAFTLYCTVPKSTLSFSPSFFQCIFPALVELNFNVTLYFLPCTKFIGYLSCVPHVPAFPLVLFNLILKSDNLLPL